MSDKMIDIANRLIDEGKADTFEQAELMVYDMTDAEINKLMEELGNE